MRAWVLGEGPTLEPQNVETIGYAIHAHIEARDYKAASKAWDDDYFWSTGYQSNWKSTRMSNIYITACDISDGAVLQVIEAPSSGASKPSSSTWPPPSPSARW